jgi:hypothetical protein
MDGIVVLSFVRDAELGRAQIMFQAARLEVDWSASSKFHFWLQVWPHEGSYIGSTYLSQQHDAGSSNPPKNAMMHAYKSELTAAHTLHALLTCMEI